MEVIHGNNVTATEASETSEPAGGSGSSHKSSSAIQNPVTGVSSQALVSGIATAETVVPEGTQRNQAPDGDTIANMETTNRAAQRKVIDIGVLSEDELLCKLRGYINSMCAFAQSTRNVHKELKETLANSSIIMAQYVKVRGQGRNGDPTVRECNSVRTQTQEYAQNSAAFFEAKKAGAQATAGKKATDIQPEQSTNSQDKQEAILKVCEALAASLARQQEDINALKSNHSSSTQDTSAAEAPQDLAKAQSGTAMKPVQKAKVQQRQKQQLQRQEQRQQPQQSQEQHFREEPEEAPQWTEVVRRKKPKPIDQSTAEKAEKATRPRTRNKSNEAARLVKSRTPKTEAIMIDRLAEGETYASVMKRVTAIDLNPLGVTVKGVKRSKAGGIIIEVDGKDDADRLAEGIKEAVGATAAVRRPTRSTPILILDVPNWMKEAEVVSHLVNFDSSFGDCQIRISDNQVGRTVFCRIPMKVASKVADSKKIRIGWAMCRTKLLERKERICYKCQETGHLAAACYSEAKPKECYRCKSLAHLARECTAPLRRTTTPTRSRSPAFNRQES